MKVAKPCQEYEDLIAEVIKNRDVVTGERAIKNKTTDYLPALPSMRATTDLENGQTRIMPGLTPEGKLSYDKYLSLAYFYGATGRTVEGLNGLIFMKKPQSELPDGLLYLKDNCNAKGDTLRNVAKKATEEAFVTPRSGFLVDYPSAGEALSQLEAEARNLRPKILHYTFENIYKWFYSTVDNITKLSFLVLREKRDFLVDGEIESTYVYRVLEIIDGVYYQSEYDDDDNLIQGPTPIYINGETVSEIPFYFIESKKPVINDLVDANLNHYRFFADYAHKEHSSAFPIFWETGAHSDGGNGFIGPDVKWENPSSDAQFGVLQTASDGGSMRQYLLDMEQRMAALGAEMLKPRISGAESAEAKALDQVAQNSTVASVANKVSDALTQALKFCARWMGLDGEEIYYQLSTDYNPSRMNAQDLTALMAAWQSGGISYETFYQNLVTGEIASPERTAEDEQALVFNEGLSIGN